MHYFRLIDDLDNPKDRWFLKSLNLVDENKISVWKFVTPNRLDSVEEKLIMSIRERGASLDFTFSDFEVIIVNQKVADLLSESECQLIPVNIKGIKSDETYYVVIVLNSVDCVDENKSVFDKWQPDDPIRPDKAGMYKSIYKLFVDTKKIYGNNIFRLGKSNNIIVVNENIKNKFEQNNIIGVKFQAV